MFKKEPVSLNRFFFIYPKKNIFVKNLEKYSIGVFVVLFFKFYIMQKDTTLKSVLLFILWILLVKSDGTILISVVSVLISLYFLYLWVDYITTKEKKTCDWVLAILFLVLGILLFTNFHIVELFTGITIWVQLVILWIGLLVEWIKKIAGSLKGKQAKQLFPSVIESTVGVLIILNPLVAFTTATVFIGYLIILFAVISLIGSFCMNKH